MASVSAYKQPARGGKDIGRGPESRDEAEDDSGATSLLPKIESLDDLSVRQKEMTDRRGKSSLSTQTGFLH